MRTRGGLDRNVSASEFWNDSHQTGLRYRTVEYEFVDGQKKPKVHSLSGRERNKLFLNVEGRDYQDVSLVSNVDSIADGRCFAVWDYNHDGLQDIALINTNAPHFQLFRNAAARTENSPRNFLVVRLVGGNDQPVASSNWSNRDGYGALITVQAGGRSIIREHRCGEGFSSQNSSTIVVGLGSDKDGQIEVAWPSGKTQICDRVESGTLVTFFENPTMASNSEYSLEVYEPAQQSNDNPEMTSRRIEFEALAKGRRGDLLVFVTMATWCQACKKHLQGIRRLNDMFSDESVEFVGIPIDPNETAESLSRYESENAVPYRLLTDLPADSRIKVAGYIRAQMGSDQLPSTIITDSAGRVLMIEPGIPTVSAIRTLLANQSEVP